MIKKIILTILSLVIIAGIAIKGERVLEKRKEEIREEPTPKQTSITISVVNGKYGVIEQRRDFLAKLQSDKSIKISTKIAGYIKKIYVKESSRVIKGQLLATIDEEDINSNIRLLKTTLAQQHNDFTLAKQIYERNQKLYNIGGLAREQLDTSRVIMQGKKMVIETTKERINQIKHQTNYLKIKAPFSGEIDEILLYGGDLATMGKPIIVMSGGVKKLIFSYNLDNIDIKRGQKVLYRGKNIGEISTIKTSAKDGLAQAEIILKKPLNIPIGSNINIEILTKIVKGCIVPNDTLIHKRDGLYIMVYIKNKFTPLKVNSLISNTKETILASCPKESIAIGDEVELAKLGAFDNINTIMKIN
jgi:RND family efflux transporter MFP subunit